MEIILRRRVQLKVRKKSSCGWHKVGGGLRPATPGVAARVTVVTRAPPTCLSIATRLFLSFAIAPTHHVVLLSRMVFKFCAFRITLISRGGFEKW